MRVIGLMSGTSVDGIDAVLVDVSGTTHDLEVHLCAGETYLYPPDLREQILAVCHGQALTLAELAELDDAIARAFAHAAIRIQAEHSTADLIGSHGQTVYHRPPPPGRLLSESRTPHSSAHDSPNSHTSTPLGYSIQLGRGDLIAHMTQIPTISNFRAADIAVGGQGAPMVPAVDAWLLRHPTYLRCIQNIGGIGNVTYLPPLASLAASDGRTDAGHDLKVLPRLCGWDTGPGNALLDYVVQILSNGALTYDANGNWAAQGTPHSGLVERWLKDDFFHQLPPKSTGREYFGAAYAERCLAEATAEHLNDADTLATLTDLTAASIAFNYHQFLPQLPDQVIVCGGGSHNAYLLHRLQIHLPTTEVMTTDDIGFSATYREAIAFAVLAYWRWHAIPGNLPEVTGAEKAVLLGDIHDVR